MKSPYNSEELRHRISELCHDIGQVLGAVNSRLSADSSFVFTPEYCAMKDDLRLMNGELKKLKALRHIHQHCYSVLVQGDVLRNGEVIRNCPLNYELTSVIDCNLGDQTRLNKAEGSHNALWNLICAKLGALFVQKRFSVHHIVQLR
jgi:hypothetical protein